MRDLNARLSGKLSPLPLQRTSFILRKRVVEGEPSGGTLKIQMFQLLSVQLLHYTLLNNTCPYKVKGGLKYNSWAWQFSDIKLKNELVDQ